MRYSTYESTRRLIGGSASKPQMLRGNLQSNTNLHERKNRHEPNQRPYVPNTEPCYQSNYPGSYAYSPKFKSLPAYSASKSAVNSWTVHLAYELRDTSIKVNAVHPGYTKTDMNAGEGTFDIPTGAKTSVRMALLDSDGPSGSYVHMGDTLQW